MGKRRDFEVWVLVFMCMLAAISVRSHAQQPSNLPSAPEPGSSPSNQSSSSRKKQSVNPERLAVQAVGETRKAGELALVKARDWESGWLTGVFVETGQTMTPLTGPQRRELYLSQTLITPGAYMKRMFGAGIDQARGVPYQWDDGWGGYMERFASHEGQFIAANSLAALGNAALKYEPRYDRCQCSGFWPRTKHAIMRNFVTFNETETERRPQIALYAGAFGGGLISTAWKPSPKNAWAQAGKGVAGQAAYGTLLNFFIEFAGEINRKIGSKRPAPTY